MNFQNVDYFLCTVRERSFTQAAQKLHVTQQTLSGQIAALERELGCRLFLRHIPLELTEEGRAFERYAASFQRNYRAMQNEFRDRARERRGTLRVGIAMTRGRILLPRLIARFQREYPLITLEILEATNEELKDALLRDETDLVIGDLPENIPGVRTRVFYQEEVVLLLPKVLPEQLYGADFSGRIEAIREDGDLKPLSDCPFLLEYPKDIAGRIAENLLRRSDLIPIVTCRSQNIEMLLDCCVQGQGACFCPDSLLGAAVSAEQLDRMEIIRFPAGTKYAIRFGWKEENDGWKLLRQFVETAQANIRE